MIAALNTGPEAQLDPKLLTPALKTALRTIERHQPRRSSGGYGKFPHSFVALKTARRLIEEYSLVRIETLGTSGPRLMLTGRGLNTLTVMRAREERKRA